MGRSSGSDHAGPHLFDTCKIRDSTPTTNASRAVVPRELNRKSNDSCSSNPKLGELKSEGRLPRIVQSKFSDFGFEMQESFDFEIVRFPIFPINPKRERPASPGEKMPA